MADRQLGEAEIHNGEIIPPWAKFPTYERGTIGWRMGYGEDWLCNWYAYLRSLGSDSDARLAHLRRHPPAPFSWTDRVFEALNPGQDYYEQEDTDRIKMDLAAKGLIRSDASYPIWLSQQPDIYWPWMTGQTPEMAVRHFTRDFWFSSRQIAEARQESRLLLPQVPPDWLPYVDALTTGELPELNPHEGLKTMAQMLCVGRVMTPWKLGLTPDDFTGSFEMDCSYTDAFRIWVMSAFDDVDHLAKTLAPDVVPDEWATWTEEHFRYF